MDVLADVLSATKIGGTVTAEVRAGGPWGLRFQDLPTISFHYVVAGSCWLRRPAAEAIRLSAGDLALLPAGAAHAVADASDGPTVRFEQAAHQRHGESGVQIDLPGNAPHAHIVCGGYRFDARAAHPLLNLPPLLLIRAGDPRSPELAQTLHMLTAELADPAPGSRTITDRLVDVLFVHILRHWTAKWSRDQDPDPAPWLAALHDPQVAAAVSLIHQEPARPWTVDALARQVGVSRATLSRRFTRLVGEPPLAYLTRWRLEIAARRLRETTDTVTGIANAVGYTSEFAFSRAFRRHHGMPPSRYRQLPDDAGRHILVSDAVANPAV